MPRIKFMKSSIEIVDVETVGPVVGFKDSNSIFNNAKFCKDLIDFTDKFI